MTILKVFVVSLLNSLINSPSNVKFYQYQLKIVQGVFACESNVQPTSPPQMMANLAPNGLNLREQLPALPQGTGSIAPCLGARGSTMMPLY